MKFPIPRTSLAKELQENNLVTDRQLARNGMGPAFRGGCGCEGCQGAQVRVLSLCSQSFCEPLLKHDIPTNSANMCPKSPRRGISSWQAKGLGASIVNHFVLRNSGMTGNLDGQNFFHSAGIELGQDVGQELAAILPVRLYGQDAASAVGAPYQALGMLRAELRQRKAKAQSFKFGLRTGVNLAKTNSLKSDLSILNHRRRARPSVFAKSTIREKQDIVREQMSVKMNSETLGSKWSSCTAGVLQIDSSDAGAPKRELGDATINSRSCKRDGSARKRSPMRASLLHCGQTC
eukprot:6485433-Amphidinium_carterae.1